MSVEDMADDREFLVMCFDGIPNDENGGRRWPTRQIEHYLNLMSDRYDVRFMFENEETCDVMVVFQRR